MITFDKNNIMISRGDTVDKYFYLPNYTPKDGDTFVFSVKKINEQGVLTGDVVLTSNMTIASDGTNKYIRLQLTSTQTKTLTANKYCYDILFTSGTFKQTLNYPSKFVVREVVNNGQ